MKSVFVENGGSVQKIYDSLLVGPESLSIFSSGLALAVVRELARQPMCAMDLAKKLGQHEQKVYYHLRKMRDAGIVRLERSEPRFGMTAKIYSLVSPVVAAKLSEDLYESLPANSMHDPETRKALQPFVADGKFNAKMIVGAPAPHGTYEATARDGIHAIELAMFMGKYISSYDAMPYKMDVEVDGHKDMKQNLILLGSPKINTIVEKVNSGLPIFFDLEKEWSIVSKLTGNRYNYDYDAVIARFKNPFNKKKEILLLAGLHSRGLKTAVLAFTRHTHEIMKGNIENSKIAAKVVRGVDKDGDGIVDSVTFME